MNTASSPPHTPNRKARSRGFAPVMAALAVGAAVAIALGVYGRVHPPTGLAINLVGFSSFSAAKAWLATVALVFVLVQLVSALAIYGKLPRVTGGKVTAAVHRWSGRVAVAITLPVAAQCLYALGFQATDTRVLLHSVFATFFYGTFVSKMLLLTRDDTPRWLLPIAGGVVFTGFVVLWLTSSLWYFTTSGLTF